MVLPLWYCYIIKVICFSTHTQTYMAPWMSIFGDFTKDQDAMFNNFRVYGTCLLIIMGERQIPLNFIIFQCCQCCNTHFSFPFPHHGFFSQLILLCYFLLFTTKKGGIVYVGVKFVNKFATVALLCVIFSIIAVYAGIFTNINGNDNLLWVLKIGLLIYEYSEWCFEMLNFKICWTEFLSWLLLHC